MPVTVHISSKNRFFRPPGGTVSPLGAQLMATGVNVQTRAKRLCPVDTGRLRSSIQTTMPFRRGNNLVVSVGSNVNYARFVEEGTRYMKAKPYLRPALEQELR